jgi:predicted DNA-binding transcriptional regulator AlpA
MTYRYRDLAGLGIPYSRHNLGRLTKIGRFPQPRKLLNGAVVWDSAEVETWLAGRLTAGYHRC